MATDLAAWRALVDKELGGAPFDKLVHKTPEGVAIQPLYTARPGDPPPVGAAPYVRGATTAPFKICVRVEPGADIAAEHAGGAEAVWCGFGDLAAMSAAFARGMIVVAEPDGPPRILGPGDPDPEPIGSGEYWAALDPVSAVVRREVPASFLKHHPAIPMLEQDVDLRTPSCRLLRISGLPFHEAGADAADELALMLSSLVATLRQLDAANIGLPRVAPLLWAQVAIGRDTFGELCKLRALRVVWHKVLAAAGVADGKLDAIHAVCSARTLSARDPWVNMLRVTTQVFAAALGGAQLITPLPFDAALATRSPLGQRVARNTALVLREESGLGRVLDAAGGSYYLETRTDALARAAWDRFTAIERDGGIVKLLREDQLHARLEAAWAQRAAAIAKRKEPVLGVSEFANLNEKLPAPPAPPPGVHREAEAFEALRARTEAAPRDVALVLLGPPPEHRARVGFAESFFAIAGLAATPREVGAGIASPAEVGRAAPPQAVRRSIDIACVCGSDERYAAEAVATAKALKAAGANKVVLAGRPGALEADLRAAGVDAFIHLGCDALATLEEVLS